MEVLLAAYLALVPVGDSGGELAFALDEKGESVATCVFGPDAANKCEIQKTDIGEKHVLVFGGTGW